MGWMVDLLHAHAQNQVELTVMVVEAIAFQVMEVRYPTSVGATPKLSKLCWYSDIHSLGTTMCSCASGYALWTSWSPSGYSRSTSRMKPSRLLTDWSLTSSASCPQFSTHLNPGRVGSWPTHTGRWLWNRGYGWWAFLSHNPWLAGCLWCPPPPPLGHGIQVLDPVVAEFSGRIDQQQVNPVHVVIQTFDVVNNLPL